MGNRQVAEAIGAAIASFPAEQREEANLRRRREIRAELAKVPNGAEVTPAIAALFDELEALIEEDS